MSGFSNDIMYAKNADFTQADNQAVSESNGLVTNGQFWVGSTSTNAGGTHINVGTITSPNGTIAVGYSSPNITLDTTGINDLHTARYIVSSAGTSGTGANYTTITAAISAAQGTGINSTVFLQPGTYTENFTLPDNINLAAYTCDALTPNVTIVGNITCTSAGTRSISGIRLQTNSTALLTVSGTLATVVNLDNCYLNCANNTGISFSTSSASGQINITNCAGNLGTTGIKLFDSSSAGTIYFNRSTFTNSGASSTASTISAGTLIAQYSIFASPITTSGTAVCGFNWCDIDCTALNATALTHGGSGSNCRAAKSIFLSGTAAAVSISQTLQMDNCEINSTNSTAVVTGAGTLLYTPFTFTNTGQKINVTTRTPLNYGTWTPTIDGAVTGTTTYTIQQGYYTIVGNLVYVEGSITITAATGTGNAIIGGLPFTVKNLSGYNPIGPITVSSAAWAWAGATGTQLNFRPSANATTALVDSLKSGGAAFLQMTNGAATFIFSAWYQI